jgi:hypothetical protein
MKIDIIQAFATKKVIQPHFLLTLKQVEGDMDYEHVDEYKIKPDEIEEWAKNIEYLMSIPWGGAFDRDHWEEVCFDDCGNPAWFESVTLEFVDVDGVKHQTKVTF